MGWKKQTPTASASAAEWVERGMLRGNDFVISAQMNSEIQFLVMS